MEEVHTFNDVILLSDKEPKTINGSRVWFNDGSFADLDQLMIRNQGQGEIEFKLIPDFVINGPPQEKTFNFSQANTIVLEGGELFFEIHPWDQKESVLEVVGTEWFLSRLEVYETHDGFVLRTPTKEGELIIGDVYVNGRRVKSHPIEGRFVIKTPVEASLQIQSDQRGDGQVNIPLKALDIYSNGSTRVECETVTNVSIQINGSSQVSIQRVTEICDISINGSGDVHIKSGDLSYLKAIINGSGTVNANITVQKAELIQQGSGSISVGHVIQESYEKHAGNGSVTVLQRG